jgi:hypothetical protein
VPLLTDSVTRMISVVADTGGPSQILTGAGNATTQGCEADGEVVIVVLLSPIGQPR